MTTRHVEHTIDIEAPATDVYAMIADVSNWPLAFPPTVHVDHIEAGATDERIRIWATANGTAKTWTSRRALDPAALRISFRQEVSAFPVAAMGGTWQVLGTDTGSRVVLSHDYRAIDDDPDHLEWIDKAVDANSQTELAALKANTEFAATDTELSLSFTDEVTTSAAARDMYDFVNDAQLWVDRLPHVASVELREDTPGLQVLRMATLTANGDRHTTESVRVCLPPDTIVYKQTTLPALLALHTGCWRFTAHGESTIASSQHTVIIRPDRIVPVLGVDATVADARAFVRDALGTNSRATLALARDYAEGRR